MTTAFLMSLIESSGIYFVTIPTLPSYASSALSTVKIRLILFFQFTMSSLNKTSLGDLNPAINVNAFASHEFLEK